MRATTFHCIVCLLSLTACTPEPGRYLFVGNSFTYYHNMPAIFGAMVEASGDPAPYIRLIATGGATLADHLTDTAVTDALAAGDWTAVVLQEQSTLGETFLVNGIQRVHGHAGFDSAAAALLGLAGAGTPTWLVSHWASAQAPARDADALTAIIGRTAERYGARLIPIGAAWTAVRHGMPGAGLYDADSLHPTPAGSWLYACTVYRALFGHAPQELPREVRGPYIEPEEGTQHPDSIVTLANLDPNLSRRLCEVADDAVRTGPSAHAVPPMMDLPKMPTGEDARGARGMRATRWTGELLLYPFPATMALTFAGRGSGQLVLTLPNGAARTFALDSVRLDGGLLRFRNPTGPNGTVVQFLGRLAGDRLAGTAEFGDSTADLYGIGTWHAVRKP